MRAMGDGGLLGGSSYGAPPWESLGWLVVALVPAAAMFSALALAIAAMARSSKEGQYYLMPLLLVSMPLMVLAILPGTELSLGISLVPITGLIMLLRRLIEGDFAEALRYALPVMGVTMVCVWLSIRWAIDQFNREEVLFRESEQFSLGLWLRHLVRDREDLPTAGEAVLCGILLLVIKFFAGFVAPMPTTWNGFAVTTLILQFALIATPACLMAIMLTRRPAQTLLLGRPSFALTIPAAGILAVLLHPAAFWLAQGIQQLYPLSPQLEPQLAGLERMIAAAPLWQLILVAALTPAICEELAFRGFILSGLRRLGHKWGAIALTSLLFGLAHGILQQSLAAFFVGMVIGYIAVKTGSLWPGVLYHLVHNSLGLMLGRITPDLLAEFSVLNVIFAVEPGEGVVYRIPVAFHGAVLAGLILWWLKSLPYHHTAEERLQEALDHQGSPLSAKPAA
jgi:sodium transport system permease protein